MKDLEFESILVKYRHQNILMLLSRLTQKFHCLELGIGNDPLIEKVIGANVQYASWTVVEPSELFTTQFQKNNYPDTFIVNDFFPCPLGSKQFDVIICSGLLHEVENSKNLLQEIFQILKKGGCLLVDVPNARSLHRQLATEMGLIKNCYAASQRNLTLQQNKVFDSFSLEKEVTSCGFSVASKGGYFLKPLDHTNMSLFSSLDPKIYDGLNEVGKKYPELASEIFIVAEK
tara:strand:+ start:628 stop:1320 length:693 start_codon:yes stop_codon:yes gene_type:complete